MCNTSIINRGQMSYQVSSAFLPIKVNEVCDTGHHLCIPFYFSLDKIVSYANHLSQSAATER